MYELTIPIILNKLTNQKIDFCVWKNLHERTSMIEGTTDVDIHVPVKYKKDFEKFCYDNHGILVRSNIQTIPGVCHVLFPGAGGTILHLHVYHFLFTGESHIKDYLIPLSDYIINSRVEDPDLGFVISDKAENLVSTIRYYLKNSSLIGGILYFRDRKDFQLQNERMNVGKGLPDNLEDVGLSYASCLFNKDNKNSALKNYIFGKRLRYEMDAYRRFSSLGAITASVGQIVKFVSNRLLFREKKSLPVIGKFIAITGPDGAGKSTLLSSLSSKFQKKLTVRVVHFGRPPPNILTFPLHVALTVRRRIRYSPEANFTESVEAKSIGVLAGLRYVALAYDRNRLAKRVLRYINKGYLVLSDRYPSKNIGKMDSPKLTENYKSTGLMNWLARIERRLYNSCIGLDLLIDLRVSEGVAVSRNRNRNKEFKESDEEILYRLESNKNLNFKTADSIIYYNDGSLNEAEITLFNAIWKVIC